MRETLVPRKAGTADDGSHGWACDDGLKASSVAPW